MPWAARADRKYLRGALGCSTSVRVVRSVSQAEDEDPSAALRHSEVLSVENPVRHAVPEFCHATDEGVEVPTVMAG
jgi:hypothetical protein